MKKLPSTRNLQYLIKLHELKSFNKTAKACFVSQSTVSTGIQNLEEQLGVLLIERDNKSFLFTDIGEDVVAQAKLIVESANELLEMFNQQHDPMQGEVKLGVIPTIAPFIIKPLLTLVKDRYPELTLLIKEDTTANLLVDLDQGQLDLLLLALPVDTGNFKCRVIGQDPFWMVAHQNFVPDLTEIDYEKIPDQSVYLLHQEHCMTEHAVSACKLVNSHKINPFYASSIHSLIEMIGCQLGATFVPQMAINAGIIKNTELKMIKPSETAYRDIGLVWRATTRRHLTFNALSELIGRLL